MDTKTVELVIEALKQLGNTTATQAFPLLVQYTRIDGIATIIICGLLIAGVVVGMNAIVSRTLKSDDEDTQAVGTFVVCLFGGACLFILCCLFEGGFVETFAPEGAALHSLLKSAK